MSQADSPKKFIPFRFLCEPIEVQYIKPPLLEKKPGCPDAFVWRGERYTIVEKLGEWFDYHRRGRMAKNMEPPHSKVAESRGSWGVGVFYFRVLTSTGQIFDIFYDRAPKDVDHRKGEWFIYRELRCE
jgi:hypothetical protein